MRNEVKDTITEIEKRILTQGHAEVSSDHNDKQRRLRIAIDFIDTIQTEADAVEEAVRKKFPNAVIYTFSK